MLHTCITSTLSLRTRRSSLQFSPNGAYSSRPYGCCCCCSNSTYQLPLNPNFCPNLYGLRQSSLIQWSPYRRRSITRGYDRCYHARLPACGVGEICYCDDRVCDFRVRRKGGLNLRRCLVFEESSEGYDVSEAEIVLSLLSEDVDDDERFRVTRRAVRKPVVEKRGNGEIGNKFVKVNRRREEASLREENGKDSEYGLTNRTAREREETDALLRKGSRKMDEKRKENSKLRSRIEERESLLRREESRQKVRRDGSSCSSYYSFSSTGDYESENEVELKESRFLGNSSSGDVRNSNSVEIVHRDAREDDLRREDYREDREGSLTKKSAGKELFVGSSVVESDFRKKSEKKLADVSVEEMESSKRSSLKESKFSSAHESNYEKLSGYYGSYDDRKVKSSGSTRIDDERKQRLVQTGDEVSRQSENRLKYKQFVETQDTRSDDVRNTYSSQKTYSGKGETSAKVKDQEIVGEVRAAVGVGKRDDGYESNSHKVSEVSETQEIDFRKTSVSQQRFETSVNKEEYSTNILSSTNDAAKQQQQQQHDRVSRPVESRGTSQNMTNKHGTSISNKESDKLIKEDSLNLAYGSSLESKQTRSQMQAQIIKRVNYETDESAKILVTQSGNSGAISVDDRTETKPVTPQRPLSYLQETGVPSVGSTSGSAIYEVGGGSSQFDSTTVQPSKFISHEDAIGSAARLEKSSAHYVGEFVDQLQSEILSSEIQREKKSYEIKFVNEEQQNQHNLLQYSSGDPHSKEHGLKRDDQPSGSKGPADEIWNVDEQSVKERAKEENEENASKPENVIVKRNGKSLWNIFADIVRLRWSPRSESPSSGRKTGGRSSPNQSTSSEAWFSGHEAEENEGTNITQGLSGRHQETKTSSRVEESSSSSTLEGNLTHVGINVPSSSVVLDSGSKPISTAVSEGNFASTSSAEIIDSSTAVPPLRFRRSPATRGALEAGKGNSPEVGVSMEQSDSAVKKKFQRRDQVIKDRFDEWEEAYMVEAEQRKIDEMFMREALLEAKKAADSWEVPVGAVLVHNGKIIARGCNLVEELRDSTAHAEIICIREASSALRTWRLSDTTLYVTLEPCPMCAGAILQARVDTVVWGAPNKLLGADGSWIRLFPIGDGGNGLEQSDKPAAPIHPFHPKLVVRRGVLASECADAMQQFFKLRRKKDKKTETPSPPPSCLPVSHRPKFLAKMHDAFHLMFCL